MKTLQEAFDHYIGKEEHEYRFTIEFTVDQPVINDATLCRAMDDLESYGMVDITSVEVVP